MSTRTSGEGTRVLEMLTLSWASVRAQPVGAFLLDAGADERVALDLAPGSDDNVALDLDEGADSRLVADPAAVEIRERVDDNVRPEVDVVDQAVRRLVYGLTGHGLQPAPRARR